MLQLVRALVDATATSLEHARALRPQALRTSDQRRADLIFELRLELQRTPPLNDEERASLAHALDELRALEDRLARVTNLVVGALEPPKIELYAPTGTLRG